MTPWGGRMAVCILAALAAGGCGSRPPAVANAGRRANAADAGRTGASPTRDKMLAGALTVLDRLDDFDQARGLDLVFDRLNQWSQGVDGGADDWRAEALLDSLPESLRGPAALGALESRAFTREGDVAFLRDQRWLADIARGARGSAVDDLAVAENLFRWVVRSLALVGDPPMVPTAANPGTRWFLPGEVLLAGRASGPQRAWIFLDLLRQAGLDAVMLATSDRSTGALRPWVPAVIVDGEAYLFEPTYGMPIPGPDSTGIATVRQAASDPSVLGSLSLPDRPYPLQAGDMRSLAALVAADPWSLARRTWRLDRHLRTARDMRIAVDASRVAEVAQAAINVADGPGDADSDSPGEATAAKTVPGPMVGLWEFPWETLARRQSDAAAVKVAVRRELAPLELPVLRSAEAVADKAPLRPLFAARLREFRGELDGPAGAKAAYMAARPGRDALQAALEGVPQAQADAISVLYRQMKEDATYWLGVLTLAEGDDATAAEYLGRMTLEAAPDSRWADAARVNLAQALIGLGRPAEAESLLRADLSPQRFGSRLLAARLAASSERVPTAP